jgi:glycosyltransferase involved in cell wall biosynthesis
MRPVIHLVESSGRHLWLENLIESLRIRGFSQSLVTIQKRGEINDLLESRGVKIFSPKSETSPYNLIELIKLVKYLNKQDNNSFVLAQGHKPAIIAYLANILIGTGYGVIHHHQPSYFTRLQEEHRIRGFIHQNIYKAYLKRATLVQSLSRDVTDSLIELDVPSSRIIQIGHGVDFIKFQERMSGEEVEWPSEEIFPTILMVGRLAWEKNYLVALQTIAHLKQRFPQIRLLIAGTGPDELELLTEISRLQLNENVVLLGWVSNIPKLMKSVDLLLHLSLTESYGQVYIEACLANLPVFTFPAGVAIDLALANDPLIHLIMNQNPGEISIQLADYLKSGKNPRSQVVVKPHLYRDHDQLVVLDKIGDYLSQL